MLEVSLAEHGVNERALETNAELPVRRRRVHVQRLGVRGACEPGVARQTRELLALEEVAPRAIAAQVRARTRPLAVAGAVSARSRIRRLVCCT